MESSKIFIKDFNIFSIVSDKFEEQNYHEQYNFNVYDFTMEHFYVARPNKNDIILFGFR
jgi:hypothetical protein